MYLPATQQLEKFFALPGISPSVRRRFRQFLATQKVHTRGEGTPHHYCVFFLPYHRLSGQIYLGHHKKAGDWIPPGGHIEPGETPTAAALREMREELDCTIVPGMLKPFALSIKPIGRPEQGCLTHYDAWYLVKMPQKLKFKFDRREYYQANWFSIAAALAKIKKNPDFRNIISRLGVLS